MIGGRGWRHQLAALFQFDRLYRRSNCSKYQLSIETFPFGIASSDAEIAVEQSNRKGGFGTALRYASLRNLGAKVGLNPAPRERLPSRHSLQARPVPAALPPTAMKRQDARPERPRRLLLSRSARRTAT